MKIQHGFAMLLLAISPVLAADVPDKINYQGVLRKGDESHLPPGVQDVKFRLYNEENAPAALWGREIAVLLDTNGLFNVTLADDIGSALTNGVLSSVIAENANLYLGLAVGAGEEIKPRQQLLSVPYAMLAGNVKNASSNFTVKGSLLVDGTSMLTGGVTTARLQIGDGVGMTFTNNRLRIADDLTVNGNAALNYNLNVAGNTTLTNVTVNGPATLNSNLTVNGPATLNSNLAVNGTLTLKAGATYDYAAAGEENLRIVRGSIFCTSLNNPDPARSHGSGWTVGNSAIGEYQVTFDKPFSDVPSVTVSGWRGNPGFTVVNYVSNNCLQVSTYSKAGDPDKASFQFIAVGPR